MESKQKESPAHTPEMTSVRGSREAKHESNIKVMKNPSIIFALILAVLVCLGFWHDWIELAIGIKLDGGNGLLEWLISALAMACVITGSALARRQWHLCQEQRV